MGFFTNKIKDEISKIKQEAAANKIIQQKTRAAYFQEKEKQEMRVASEKAKFEADQKIDKIKNKKSNSFGSFFSMSETQKSLPTKKTKRKQVAKGFVSPLSLSSSSIYSPRENTKSHLMSGTYSIGPNRTTSYSIGNKKPQNKKTKKPKNQKQIIINL